MGHFFETITGTGANVREAQADAIDSFLHENGHRHSVRDCKLISSEKVPPQKWVTVKKGGTAYTHQEVDQTAPQEQWLTKAKFELHTHA